MSVPTPRSSITEIVADAVELQGDARRRYLRRTCGLDAELQREVESLLNEHETAGWADFLAAPLVERIGWNSAGGAVRACDLPAQPVPEQIGSYRIERRIGVGGMGVVYLAEQDQPVKRQVALKVLRTERQASAIRRFAAEGQALARLNHPNIAALYEVGSAKADERDVPYVAMEYVEGEHIVRWCDRRRLDIESRLRLFLGACAGISHAHRNGVLHCDLKPSNVLVTCVDGPTVAKVIDFGIARALEQPLVAGSGPLTRELFLGSPPYVSPESIVGGRANLDTRTDVYSLGLILYQLLAGVLPFEFDTENLFSSLREVAETDAMAPRDRLTGLEGAQVAAIAAERRCDRKALLRKLSGDLEAIVCKATQRDREQRYPTPAELAADLERHLNHQPVLARQASSAYVLARFVRRHSGAALATCLLIAVLVTGLWARTIEARRANLEADRARLALVESDQVLEFVIELFSGADPNTETGEPLSVRELLDRGSVRLYQQLEDQPLVRARLLNTIGSIYTELGDLTPAADHVGRALEIRQSFLPPGRPEIAESQGQMGIIRRQQGRLKEAEALLRSVLASRLSDENTDSALVAQSYNNLGNLLFSQERFAKSETAHRAALALREGVPPLDHEAESATNLGMALKFQHRVDEALPYLRRALELNGRSLGEDHPRYAAALVNLGIAIKDQAEARTILDRAVKLAHRTLGDKHPRYGAALINLGIAEMSLETWAGARPLFRRALEVYQAVGGPNHPRTLLARRHLVAELMLRHRWPEAIAEAEDIVASSKSPIDSCSALILLGRAERRAGRFEASAATLRRGLDIALSHFGPEHFRTLGSRTGLALTLSRLGETEQAVSLLEEVAQAYARRYSDDKHIMSLRTKSAMGYVLFWTGRHAESELYFRDYLENVERSKDRVVNIDAARHDLALSVAAQGRWHEAAELYSQVFERRKGRYPDHPLVGLSAHELALVEIRRGHRQRAKLLLEKAITIRSACYPIDDDDLRKSVEALGALHQSAASDR